MFEDVFFEVHITKTPVGLTLEKGCASKAQKQLKTTDLSSERAFHMNKHYLSQIIKNKKEKLVAGPQMLA
jgi:hypothetical protein